RDKAQLNAGIRSCDVLVCPSWSEGLPNVILEAMANGLAVLATNVGATGILVSDRTGWLLDNCSVSSIRQALDQVIAASPEEIDRKKNAALELIKSDFTWEKLIRQFLEKISGKIKR
ncbi:MAG: glycosyltransferase, partial [Bacteroidia bacterium]